MLFEHVVLDERGRSASHSAKKRMICIKLSLHQQRVHLIQVKDEEGKVRHSNRVRKDIS